MTLNLLSVLASRSTYAKLHKCECNYACTRSQEEKHVMTDRKNRQATLVRRLRSRSAKEQCHSPSDMGIQRVLKKQNKAATDHMLWGKSLRSDRGGESCPKTTGNPGHRSVSSHGVCVPGGEGSRERGTAVYIK